MRYLKQKYQNPIIAKLAGFFVLLILMTGQIGPVQAQTSLTWSQPVNLSSSGATANPRIITGASGRIHTVWEDQYSHLVYRYNDQGTWSPIINLDLPFYQMDYKLIADRTGYIFAFWIDRSSYTLFYSAVQENSFGNASSWYEASRISSGVTAFDVSVDASNQLNLVFLRAANTSDLPSGIYYQKTQGSFQRWGSPTALYTSKYYRNQLPPPGVTVAQSAIEANWSHVDIETGNPNQYYISWENPALKRLFFAYSETNGNSWTSPEEISSPTVENTYLTPKHLQTANLPQHTMQIWQLSEPGGNCSLQYRVTTENQNTWSPQQSLSNLISECPDEIFWFPADQKNTIFVFSNTAKFTILAWNGERWSLAQSQTELNQFINPETYTSLNFEQFSPWVNYPEIYNIAVDETSGDTWFSQKTIENLDGWFNSISSWSTVSNLVINERSITDLKAFTGINDNVSFVWSVEDRKDNGQFFSKLQIGELDSEGVMPGYLSVRNNLSGEVLKLDLSVFPEQDKLNLIWQGGIYGQLNSAWADLTQLYNPVGWSEIFVDTSFPFVNLSEIVTNQAGELFSLYTRPMDQADGVYLSQTTDFGETWLEPNLIFSSESLTDCPVLEQPQLSIRGNYYQLMYICSTGPGGLGTLSLNYVSSADLGQTWSTPQIIAEGKIDWYKFIEAQDGTLHRLWMTYDGETALFHTYSKDQGINWLSLTNFSLSQGENSKIQVVVDDLGYLHVLQAVPLESNIAQIQYHYWNGNTWNSRETFEFFTYQNQDNLYLASAIDSSQNLTLGIIVNTSSIASDTNQIITTRYALGITPQPQTETNNTVVTPTPENITDQDENHQSPTPTLEPLIPTQTAPINPNPGRSTNMWLGIGFGSMAAFGVMVLTFVFIKRKNS